MTAVYHGRSEKMDLEDFLRSTPDQLQHVGVKGMKWGRRKPSEKKLAKKDAKWEKSQDIGKLSSDAHNKALPKMNKFIEKLDNKYKDADFDNENDPKTQSYFKEFEAEYKRQINAALDSTPSATSPSGRKKAQAFMLDYGSFVIEVVDSD